MRGLSGAVITTAVALFSSVAVGAQGLLIQWTNNRPSWEASLEAGDGQKVRREAEALLKRPELQISLSNYNEQHVKVAILGIAARGAVIEGDWPDAITLLEQAFSTAQANYASASETLENLRKQHEVKLSEWKTLIKPQEERLRWLKGQPGLRSEQIEEFAQIESFLAEHNNAISNSEQAVKDIDEILSLLRDEQETCVKSLREWSDFLLKEQRDIRELGSTQKYVVEKLAQISGDTGRSRFERIAYTRRLLKLDPTNQSCQQFLSSLVGGNSPQPPPATPPTRTTNRPPNSSSK